MSTQTEWCFSRKSSGRCGHGIRLNQVNFMGSLPIAAGTMVTNRHRDGKRPRFPGFPWAVVFDFFDFAPPAPSLRRRKFARKTPEFEGRFGRNASVHGIGFFLR